MRWLVDGKLDATMPADDRGLAFGDGAFETIRIRNASVEAWPLHWQRLGQSLQQLGLPSPVEAQVLADVDRLGVPANGVLKIIVSAGSSSGGYARPPNLATRTIIGISDDCPTWPENGVALFDCRTRLAVQAALAGLKHLCRLEQVLARQEWDDDAWQDGLMHDTRGHIIETTCGNLMLCSQDGLWLTPQLADSGVAGIMRQRLINHLAGQGETVTECLVDAEHLAGATEVLVMNSVRGIAAVRCWRKLTWPLGPRCRELRAQLDNDTKFGMT